MGISSAFKLDNAGLLDTSNPVIEFLRTFSSTNAALFDKSSEANELLFAISFVKPGQFVTLSAVKLLACTSTVVTVLLLGKVIVLSELLRATTVCS